MALQVDIRVPLGLPVPRLAEFIQRCEDSGFAGVGVHDHSETGRDCFATLTLAASRTRRLVLYPAVTNGITRHPVILASIANSLEEIAPGRIRLIVGTGDVIIRRIGKPRGTLEALRGTVGTVRGLLAGQALPFEQNPSLALVFPSRPPTPVYVTCAGPRGAELAGEIGDGVFALAGIDARSVAAARRHIAAGAARAGRSADRIPVIWVAQLHLDSDVKTARDWARRWFEHSSRPVLGGAPRIPKAYRDWFGEAGIPVPADPGSISDEAIDAMGLFGPPEYCLERLERAREEAGIDRVFLMVAHVEEGKGDITSLYQVPEAEVAAFARSVLPRLR